MFRTFTSHCEVNIWVVNSSTASILYLLRSLLLITCCIVLEKLDQTTFRIEGKGKFFSFL